MPIILPGGNEYEWPVTLTIHRADLYQRRAYGALNQPAVYLSFSTYSGDKFANLSGRLIGFGMVRRLAEGLNANSTPPRCPERDPSRRFPTRCVHRLFAALALSR